MSGFSLKPFFADIYQECPDADFPKAKKLLKIDGDGQNLKACLGLGKLKSCDFITGKQGFYRLIEVSDLKSQYQSLQARAAELKRHLSTKELKSCFYPKEVIAKELREKYIHSLLILNTLQTTKQLKNREKQFIVVLCQADKTDVMAFQFVVSKLTQSLCGLVDKVEVVPLEQLHSRLSA